MPVYSQYPSEASAFEGLKLCVDPGCYLPTLRPKKQNTENITFIKMQICLSADGFSSPDAFQKSKSKACLPQSHHNILLSISILGHPAAQVVKLSYLLYWCDVYFDGLFFFCC